MKYIIRNEEDVNIIDNDDDLKLSQFLRDNYEYIYNSLIAHDYDLRFEEYTFFCELVFEGKVVGFASYLIDAFSTVCLTNVFVLPEFRGNQLFIENLFYMIVSSEMISIREPTRNLVEILIHYNLAEKLTDSLVACPIYLEILNEDIISKNAFSEDDCLSNLYDLKLCSTLVLQDITTPGVCIIDYHNVLADDDKKYGAGYLRQSLNLDEYFEDIKKVFLKNADEFKDILLNLTEKMPSFKMDFDQLIGDGEGLSEFMLDLVDESIISIDRAFEIKNQLKNEYDNNIVTSEGLKTRLRYLVENNDLSSDTELFLENIQQTNMLCPYCYQPVSPTFKSCKICGYNINDNELLDYDEVLNDLMKSEKNIIDLRTDYSNSQEEYLLEILKDIYETGDEKSFDEINKEYDLGFSSIDDLKNITLQDEVIIDYFGDQYTFIKNNTHPITPIIDNKIKKYSFFDDLESNLKNPGLSYDLFTCLSKILEDPHLYDFLYDLDLYNSPVDLESILFGNNMIQSKKYGSKFWNMVYNSFTVSQMKDALRKYHLKVSGNKRELVNRLKNYSIYKEFGGDEFVLTYEGEEFLRHVGWIANYETWLSCFDFIDIETFMSRNRTKTSIEGFYNYLDNALEIAEKHENLNEILDIISSKSMLLVNEAKYKPALTEEIKIFILRMNMEYLDENEYENFEPIIYSNINNIAILSEITNANLKKEFKKAMKKLNLKKQHVPQKIAFTYLKKALHGDDMEVLSNNIVKTYFIK